MSNTCPKCGAKKSVKISTQYELVYCCNSCQYIGTTGVPFIQSDLCRGRAEAIAELDAWHTGEPPVGVSRVIVRLKGLDGQYGYDYAWLDCRGDGLWYWSAGDRSGKWCDYWQWREVRP